MFSVGSISGAEELSPFTYIPSIFFTSGSSPINLASDTRVIITPAISWVNAKAERMLIYVPPIIRFVLNVAKHSTLSII